MNFDHEQVPVVGRHNVLDPSPTLTEIFTACLSWYYLLLETVFWFQNLVQFICY